jgi:hypothetical protein
MAKLRTDYNDAIYTGSKKYNIVENDDGTVSLEDKTVYYQRDNTSLFGANDINMINKAINDINEKRENGTLDFDIERLDRLDENSLDTKCIFIVSKGGKLYKTTTRALAEYLGKTLSSPSNVYWNNGTWSCPGDGFITLRGTSSRSASYMLIYIANKAGETVCSLYGSGANGTFTTMFPVHKGQEYRTSYAVGQSNIEAIYTKLG